MNRWMDRWADTVRWHPALMTLAAGMAGLAVVCALGVLIDDRTLAGEPIWLKPLNFSLSIAAYAATLAWMLALLPPHRRWPRRAGTLIAVLLAAEQVIIIGQVVRGRRSHFNVTAPLDSDLYTTMAAMIGTLWVASFAIGIALLFTRLPDRVQAWAVRSGLLVSLAGMLVGILMTQPTAAQRQALEHHTGGYVGAHTVGMPDGGPGLPLTGWSTVAGDLRVPHFVGLHALQVLPLVAVLLAAGARRWPRLTERRRVRLVVLAAVAHSALVGVLVWQAERAQSVVRPDGATLAALAAVGAVALAGATAILRLPGGPAAPGRPRPDPVPAVATLPNA